jgi:hypothetical protein
LRGEQASPSIRRCTRYMFRMIAMLALDTILLTKACTKFRFQATVCWVPCPPVRKLSKSQVFRISVIHPPQFVWRNPYTRAVGLANSILDFVGSIDSSWVPVSAQLAPCTGPAFIMQVRRNDSLRLVSNSAHPVWIFEQYIPSTMLFP